MISPFPVDPSLLKSNPKQKTVVPTVLKESWHFLLKHIASTSLTLLKELWHFLLNTHPLALDLVEAIPFGAEKSNLVLKVC
jgi:hypothetical protein